MCYSRYLTRRFTLEDNFSSDCAGLDIKDNHTGKRYDSCDGFIELADLLNELYEDSLNINESLDKKVAVSLDALQQLFNESYQVLPEEVYNIQFKGLRDFIIMQQELIKYYKETDSSEQIKL